MLATSRYDIRYPTIQWGRAIRVKYHHEKDKKMRDIPCSKSRHFLLEFLCGSNLAGTTMCHSGQTTLNLCDTDERES